MNCSGPIFPGSRWRHEGPDDGPPLRGMVIGAMLATVAWGIVWAMWRML